MGKHKDKSRSGKRDRAGDMPSAPSSAFESAPSRKKLKKAERRRQDRALAQALAQAALDSEAGHDHSDPSCLMILRRSVALVLQDIDDEHLLCRWRDYPKDAPFVARRKDFAALPTGEG